MKAFFYLLFLFFAGGLLADMSSDHVVVDRNSVAPLLPLSPGLSVGITLANREMLMDSPGVLAAEAQRNMEILSEHSFPWLSLLGMALAGVVLGLVWNMKDDFLRRRAHSALKTPYEEAVSAVEQLKNESLPQQQRYDEFFTRLPNIIRAYIEKAHGLPALEKTTEELLIDSQFSTLFSADSQQLLSAILQIADRVKFAKHLSNPKECAQAVSRAEDFFNRQQKVTK